MPILTVQMVTKVFTDEQVRIKTLTSVNFSVQPGEFVCIIGPSGCGKSTLLRILSGLTPPTSGTVSHDPQLTTSFVFQQFALFPWLTAYENIAFPPHATHIHELMSEVGLQGFSHLRPKQLSGGMRQRVGIARALAKHPDILFMDEPFSALDALTARSLRSLVLDIWAKRRLTVVCVTHLVEEAVQLADRVLVMSPRPGTIIKDLPIALPRPRSTRSPEFFALVDSLSALITT